MSMLFDVKKSFRHIVLLEIDLAFQNATLRRLIWQGLLDRDKLGLIGIKFSVFLVFSEYFFWGRIVTLTGIF